MRLICEEVGFGFDFKIIISMLNSNVDVCFNCSLRFNLFFKFPEVEVLMRIWRWCSWNPLICASGRTCYNGCYHYVAFGYFFLRY